MKRVALAILLFACAEGLCQGETPFVDLRQGHDSNSTEAQSQKTGRWESLPDAPSADAKHAPLMLGETGMNTVTPAPPVSLVALYTLVNPTESRNFFDKYLYPSLLKRNSRYRPVGGGSFIRRATDAASQILITRDDSGKGSLNDLYFPGALTSAIVQTAYSPYWTRSASTPFNNFGSILGSDVGLNVFHEFEADIRQMITAHTPRVLSKVEGHISQVR